MRRFRWDNNRPRLAVVGLIVMVGAVTGVGPPASADAGRGGLSEQSRLADRRFVAIGDRAYEVGAEDARYPATGWHIRGEMGGFWSPPIKLLDGLWFAVDGQWVRNLRVAGTGELRLGKRTETFTARELTDDEKYRCCGPTYVGGKWRSGPSSRVSAPTPATNKSVRSHQITPHSRCWPRADRPGELMP